MIGSAPFGARAMPLFVAAFAMAGCVSSTNGPAPSLAKRAVEGRFDVAPPSVAVDPPGPLPADLAGCLARWEGDAAAAERAFAAERIVTSPLVVAAAGAAVASEKWIVAQQAVSRLQATRTPLTGALADIDRLYIDRRTDDMIDGLPSIYALRERLAAMAMAQAEVIAGLNAQLPE